MKRWFDGHVKLLQTDVGPEFKTEFESDALLFCDCHRVAGPYRKNEQAYIESFNWTVRKECLGWTKYRVNQLTECQGMVEVFLKLYHLWRAVTSHYHRPHMGKGMIPPSFNNERDYRILK